MKKPSPAAPKATKNRTAAKSKRKNDKKALDKSSPPPVRTIKTLGKVGTISLARIRAAVKAVAAQRKTTLAAGNTSIED